MAEEKNQQQNNQNHIEQIEKKPEQLEIPAQLPLLPLQDVVVFPFMLLPLVVSRESSIKAVNTALGQHRLILLVTEKTPSEKTPEEKDLYRIGTVAVIVRMLKNPDGRIKILVQGLTRAKLLQLSSTEPFLVAKLERLFDKEAAPSNLQEEALMRNVKEQFEKSVSLGKTIHPDVLSLATTIEDLARLADIVVANLNVKIQDAQKVLEIIEPVERLKLANELLNREVQLLSMQQQIQDQAREEMDRTQKEYYLREQMKAIQDELGDADPRVQEFKELQAKIEQAKMPEDVQKEAVKQLERLRRSHPDAAEATMMRTYLDWLVEMPWSKSSEDNLDIKRASKILDEDHYNLEKVKERILEFLSVHRLKKKMKGPIMCFVGPPGVGKTSLGKSIARALGRQFVRLSLGGVRDEAEIRGHRRTYIGALPGRIIQSIHQAGTNNPVFMLDEVDKIGADYRGDPSAALLEVLDPEQNNSFTDHYLGVPFDLSNVMFITTANILDPILPAFRDRMEILVLSGYTEEEKIQIAKKFLIPRQLEENGINSQNLTFTDAGLKKIISGYTREAGLRNLERQIASVCRKTARRIAEGNLRSYQLNTRNVASFLSAPKFLPEQELISEEIGVATGLAWTEAGGDVIFIEATTMKGKGALIYTGHLGEVMRESIQAALSYARSRAKNFGIEEDFYQRTDIHVHVPAAAIPKDGPSAGITIATAIISCLTKIPCRKEVAMTGEVTLRGRVLPIGGVKEKVLAARRIGAKVVILPKANVNDINELPAHISKGLKISLVEDMDQVLNIALVKKLSENSKKS